MMHSKTKLKKSIQTNQASKKSIMNPLKIEKLFKLKSLLQCFMNELYCFCMCKHMCLCWSKGNKPLGSSSSLGAGSFGGSGMLQSVPAHVVSHVQAASLLHTCLNLKSPKQCIKYKSHELFLSITF